MVRPSTGRGAAKTAIKDDVEEYCAKCARVGLMSQPLLKDCGVVCVIGTMSKCAVF